MAANNWHYKLTLINFVRIFIPSISEKRAKLINRGLSMNIDQVQNLKQLINFQDDSVVSKEIINQAMGTVTLFAFAAGQGLSEHSAPYDALVVAVEGKAEITVSGQTQEISEGQILLMPAHSPHSIKANDPFKMLLIMIKS